MDHEREIRWRREYFQMLRDVGVSIDTVELLGDIEEIIQAEKLIENPEGIVVKWIGPCKEEEFGKGTLDVHLEVKSFGGKYMPYPITVKLYDAREEGRSNEENTYILRENDIKHECHESQFRFVKRLPPKCHHIIAIDKFLPDGFIKYCQEEKGIKIIEVKPRYHNKVPEAIIKLYDDLKGDSRIDAIDRRRIIYKNLKK